MIDKKSAFDNMAITLVKIYYYSIVFQLLFVLYII